MRDDFQKFVAAGANWRARAYAVVLSLRGIYIDLRIFARETRSVDERDESLFFIGEMLLDGVNMSYHFYSG